MLWKYCVIFVWLLCSALQGPVTSQVVHLHPEQEVNVDISFRISYRMAFCHFEIVGDWWKNSGQLLASTWFSSFFISGIPVGMGIAQRLSLSWEPARSHRKQCKQWFGVLMKVNLRASLVTGAYWFDSRHALQIVHISICLWIRLWEEKHPEF